MIIKHLVFNWVITHFCGKPQWQCVILQKRPVGKCLSWVLTGDGAEVFMCSLCAATTCPHCQTTSRLRAGTPGINASLTMCLGLVLIQPPRSQFVSSLSQIEVPTQLSENLCFVSARITHTHTLLFNTSWNLLISITCLLRINQEPITALPPSNLSYLRSSRIDFTVGVRAPVSPDPTAGCVPGWDVKNVACSAVDNTCPLGFWLRICSFRESSLVNQPVVQECVSCLVRGRVPSGIHTISFPKWMGEESATHRPR